MSSMRKKLFNPFDAVEAVTQSKLTRAVLVCRSKSSLEYYPSLKEPLPDSPNAETLNESYAV